MSNEEHLDDGGYGVPFKDEKRGFRVFAYNEIYRGPDHEGQWVPNPGDLIVDVERNVFENVISVDYTNYSYVTENFSPLKLANQEGVAFDDSQFKVYIDTTKHPATLRFDSQLYFRGSENSYIRLFKGSNITESGTAINATIVNGNLVSQTTALVQSSIENNVTIKNPVASNAIIDVEDGEVVTAVTYTNDGIPTSITKLFVMNTNLVMALETPSRQILDIKLNSPFISNGDSTLLMLPVNIPLDDIPMDVTVTYNSGEVTYPIDGSKIKIDGLRNSGSHDTFYISSIIGQRLDLVLSYRLSDNEIYVGDDIVERTIVRDYAATTLAVDGAYSVKLYTVPMWLDNERGYRLKYYLSSIERGNIVDVTDLVEYGEVAAVFDPLLYNVKQRLNVRLDLSKVNQIYTAHIHAQSFHITLLKPGHEDGDSWLIEYQPTSDPLGAGAKAYFDYENVDFTEIWVDCGASSKQEWLELLYDKSYPLFDIRDEDTPLVPTHVEVCVGSKNYIISVDTWMDSLTVENQVQNGGYIVLKWIRRTANDDLYLAATPMMLYQKA